MYGIEFCLQVVARCYIDVCMIKMLETGCLGIKYFKVLTKNHDIEEYHIFQRGIWQACKKLF
jgi:hypothetical protein